MKPSETKLKPQLTYDHLQDVMFLASSNLPLEIQKLSNVKKTNIALMLCYKQGRTQEGVGVKVPRLSLIFYKIFITCSKEIKCFRMLFACEFVDLMQITRNKFACKFQGTL